jgi:hypothetical protein
MQQKPVPEQKLQKQRLSASGRDIIQATAPGELTDTWTRINAPKPIDEPNGPIAK